MLDRPFQTSLGICLLLFGIYALTGHAMDASCHFPAENFGGEGFSNLGNVQNALSGPVLDNYLAMADLCLWSR